MILIKQVKYLTKLPEGFQNSNISYIRGFFYRRINLSLSVHIQKIIVKYWAWNSHFTRVHVLKYFKIFIRKNNGFNHHVLNNLQSSRVGRSRIEMCWNVVCFLNAAWKKVTCSTKTCSHIVRTVFCRLRFILLLTSSLYMYLVFICYFAEYCVCNMYLLVPNSQESLAFKHLLIIKHWSIKVSFQTLAS